MSRIEINLAHQPFRNDTLAWVLVGSLAAAGLGLSIWNVGLFLSLRSQITVLTEQREELTARQREAEREEKRLLRTGQAALSQLGASRATFANLIIQQWAFSWTKLFNELERVIPYGVRLRSIRPRFEDGVRVRVGAVARNNEAFWSFQESLQGSPAFGDVYPDVVQASDPRMSLMRGEQLVSMEMEYYPGDWSALAQAGDSAAPGRSVIDAAARRERGAASDAAGRGGEPGAAGEEPGAVGQASMDANQAPAAGARGPVPVAGGVGRGAGEAAPPPPTPSSPAAGRAGGGSGSQPTASAPGAAPRGRGNRRMPAAGVQRTTPFPAASPTAPRPDMSGKGRRPKVPGLDLSDYTLRPDGTLVDSDGNVVTLDDVMKNEGHIRPLRTGERPPRSLPEEPEPEDQDGAGSDSSSGGRGGR